MKKKKQYIQWKTANNTTTIEQKVPAASLVTVSKQRDVVMPYKRGYVTI